MLDESGADVSLDAWWRSSMMANSGRDPFWQASVSKEVLERPEAAETIEGTCATCHMPMASHTQAILGEPSQIFGSGLLSSEHPLHALAMDGVSCTLCHQIQAEGLGFPASYNGGFTVDAETPAGERLIYGPYSVEENHATIMQDASSYVPVQGLHQADSELCGTCHTFFLDDPDTGLGDFPLLMTYFEWFYSGHRGLNSCQDCHMPEAEGGVLIAAESDFPRSPFAQHALVGGNAYMLEMLGSFIEEIGSTASEGQFQAAKELTEDFLSTETARIEIDEIRLSGGRLTADLVIRNEAGHKFPSGFPSRRAWIRFAVEDRLGETAFESGGFDDQGRILGNANDEDPNIFEQHYFAIVQPEQVQIYETIMGDDRGSITTTLNNAVQYLKDNRLMPTGQDKFGGVEVIQPRGRAVEDEDFQGGVDEIQYAIDLRGFEGPFTVTIEILFQSIASQWAEALRGLSSEEADRFVGYYDAVPNLPVSVAKEVIEIED